MRAIAKWVGAAAVAALGMSAASAFAHHHNHRGHFHGGPRVSFGISVGAPLWSPWYHAPRIAYFPPPVYVPPRVVYVAPPEPVVYVERDSVPLAPPPAPAPQAQSSWWYYCADSRGYYPYVRECPGGWQRVAPRPAD